MFTFAGLEQSTKISRQPCSGGRAQGYGGGVWPHAVKFQAVTSGVAGLMVKLPMVALSFTQPTPTPGGTGFGSPTQPSVL